MKPCSPTWTTHYAAALNRAGQHARAKDLLSESLAQLAPEEHSMVVLHLEPQRQLALAEAGVGDYAGACQRLDALLQRYGQEDNHLLVGLLHKARAEVALDMQDAAAVRTHLERVEHHFRATSNPALIAQLERLVSRAQPRAATAPDQSTATESAKAHASIMRSFAELSARPERHKHALALALGHARAAHGFLYMLHGDAFRLVAANSPTEPPLDLENALRESALRLQNPTHTDDADADDTRMLEAETNSVDSHQLVMLTLHEGQRMIVVGGLILQNSQNKYLDAVLLHGIAHALHHGHDAASTF